MVGRCRLDSNIRLAYWCFFISWKVQTIFLEFQKKKKYICIYATVRPSQFTVDIEYKIYLYVICTIYNTNLFATQSVSVYSRIAVQFSDVEAKVQFLSKEAEKRREEKRRMKRKNGIRRRANILFWREFHRIEWRKAECNAILFTVYCLSPPIL